MLFIFFESLGQDLLGRWLKAGDEDHTVVTTGVIKLSGLEQMLKIYKTELGSSNIGGFPYHIIFFFFRNKIGLKIFF